MRLMKWALTAFLAAALAVPIVSVGPAAAFEILSTTAAISASTTTARAAVPDSQNRGKFSVRVYNAGTASVFVKTGDVTVVATTSDTPLLAGATETFETSNIDAVLQTYVAAITASGTATVYVTAGFGGADGYAAGASSITGGTTALTGCANTRVLFDDAGVIGCDAEFKFDKTNDTINLGGATLTASDPILDLTQTWNSAGVTFTGLKANITSTASSAASLLMDLQVGGATKFNVRKDGQTTISGSLHSATLLSLIGDSGGVAFEANGVNAAEFQGDQLRLNYATPKIAFNNDLYLLKDAANTLAQRNGTAAQMFSIYNTWTDASNYERLQFEWSGNKLYLATIKAGSGTLRSIQILGGADLEFATNNNASPKWKITTDGHFLAFADNTYDIGASGATRPRNVYIGTDLVFATTGLIRWATDGSRISNPSNGVIRLTDSGETAFGSLLLGPSGTTYNRLKHDAAGILAVKLADDSAYSDIKARTIASVGFTVAGLPTAGVAGRRAHVTDQLTACVATGAAITGGGALVCPVFDNGVAWVGAANDNHPNEPLREVA